MKVNYKDIQEIQELIIAYANGDFSKRVELNSNIEFQESLVSSINMLGEELEDITISRDYFSNIYNAVSDMLIITDTEGNLTDVNNAISIRTGLNKDDLIGKDFRFFIPNGDLNLSGKSSINFDTVFINAFDSDFPINCSISPIISRYDQHSGYLIIAEDITEKKKREEKMLKVIVSTQEKERKRLAYDLHDSLGQELNAIKMYLSTLNYVDKSDKDFDNMFIKCQNLVDHSIDTIRKIAFDLMPKTLESGDLCAAIEQLSENFIGLNIDCDFVTKKLDIELDDMVLIYRIFQEFLSNSMKYAESTKIDLSIKLLESKLVFNLSDDGIGFEVDKVKNGNGVYNIKSRLKAINASYNYTSKKNKGATLNFVIDRWKQ